MQYIEMPFHKGRDNPMYGKHPSNWKGYHINDQGYILIHSPNHPHRDNHNYVRQHRLVMEEYLGRYLTNMEDIHHINGNKQDNRIENLQLISKSEHSRLHFPKGSRFGANKDE